MRVRIRSMVAALLVVGAPLVFPTESLAAPPGPGATGWPQYGGSARHQNVNPSEHAFTPGNVSALRVAWRGVYGTNATDESSPVVANGVAYIAGFDGRVSAFDPGGGHIHHPDCVAESFDGSCIDDHS